jgi:glutathione S-transferase
MLQILGIPFSAHTRKAIIVAIEKGVAYQLVPVAPLFSSGPMAPPADWARLSPLGTIPVLRDGDLVIPDSSVIGLYLERRFPEPALYPSGAEALAEALWIEEYVDSGLQQHVLHGLLAERALARLAMNREPDLALIERSLTQEIPPRLAYLEERLAGRRYFAGDAFSIADIAVVSILINYHYAGCELSAEAHPRLRRHLEEQLARPSFQKAFESELPAARKVPTLSLGLVERAARAARS